VRVSLKLGLHVTLHNLEVDSAHKEEGQVSRQVQLPVYPKVGGLAGQTSTHNMVKLSANDPPVQVATQYLFIVLASPKEF